MAFILSSSWRYVKNLGNLNMDSSPLLKMEHEFRKKMRTFTQCKYPVSDHETDRQHVLCLYSHQIEQLSS